MKDTAWVFVGELKEDATKAKNTSGEAGYDHA